MTTEFQLLIAYHTKIAKLIMVSFDQSFGSASVSYCDTLPPWPHFCLHSQIQRYMDTSFVGIVWQGIEVH